jgi:predicted TPR repeat methyltransferase
MEHMRIIQSPSNFVSGDDQGCNSRFTVVDLGCGTGLVGQHLRTALDVPNDTARSSFNKGEVEVILLGVDLSPRMAEIARSKELDGHKVYNRVNDDDAVNYLSHLRSPVDCIVAADVFIYIGDLNEVFKVPHEALDDDGVVIFSVEQILPHDNKDGVGMKLLRSG